jgi:hypothetical protein
MPSSYTTQISNSGQKQLDRSADLISCSLCNLGDNFLNLLVKIFKMVIAMVEEKSKGERESLHHRAERHAFHNIIDAVFGLSLGLGAFSLTELPITNAPDLFAAIGFFGFSYFIIFMSWMGIRVYFEDYIIYGSINGILIFTGFFIAIMPLPLRIVLMQSLQPTSPDILEAAWMLYPICLSVITLTSGLFSFAFSKQSWKAAPLKDLEHLLTDGVMLFVMGLVFLVSAFMPYEITVEHLLGQSIIQMLPSAVAKLPYKVGFWFVGGFVMATPAYIAARIVLWRKRSSMPTSG